MSKQIRQRQIVRNPRIPTTIHVRTAINISKLEDFLTSLAGSYPILDKVGQGNGTVPLTALLRSLPELEQNEKTPNEISYRCG